MVTSGRGPENGKNVTTMAEYIERDAAIAALTEFCYDQTASKYLSIDDCLLARDAIERATKVLESLPAADVEPVRHGRCGTHSDIPDSLICSVCNCRFDMRKHEPHNYCPNCGAKMDLEV